MSNKLQTTQRRDIQSYLGSPDVQAKIAEVLPRHLTAERMTRIMLYSIGRTPQLAQCTPTSLLQAMMKCSMMGIEPDGHHAHLIPYGTECQLIVDYKGLVRVAADNGIKAKGAIVCENDKFVYQEDDGTGKTRVSHSFDPTQSRGKIIGAYSRAVDKDGYVDYEFMTIEAIEAIRKRSRSAHKGPWVTDYEEMVKKTPLRRHSKRWDLRAAPMAHAALDQEDDAPAPMHVEEVRKPELPPPSGGPKHSAPAPEPEPAKPDPAPEAKEPESTDTDTADCSTETVSTKPDDEGEAEQKPQDSEQPPVADAPKQDSEAPKSARAELLSYVGEHEIEFADFRDFAKLAFKKVKWDTMSDYPDIHEDAAAACVADKTFMKRVKQYLGKRK